MKRPHRCILVVLFSVAAATWPSATFAQNFIGDALGQLIGPAVGPVLERAAGEIVVEGVRRGYENGRLLPRGRATERPTFRGRPTQPTYGPQPTYRPAPVSSTRPLPVSPPAGNAPGYPSPYPDSSPSPASPATSPPDNSLARRPPVSPNLSPTEIAMTHVVATGPEFSRKVIRTEARKIMQQLDSASLQFTEANPLGPAGQSFRDDYRNLLSESRPDHARSALLISHPNALESSGNRQAFSAVLQAADAAEQLASLSRDADHESTIQSVDRLRENLTNLRGSVVAGKDLAILAERTKNLRNAAVLSEIARMLGVQRQEDLFERVAIASDKSGAPREAVAGLLGVTVGTDQDAVSEMRLPPGIPAVVLYNSSTNTSPIHFVCDDSLEVTLAPGELVPLDQAFVVAFQTGTGTVKRYSIKQGLYRWAVQQDGWDLLEKRDANLIIDASYSPVAFHYLFNGQPQVIDPGMTITHQLNGPARIDFDLGRNDGTVKSTLCTPGHHVVGVNAESGGWDLLRIHPADSDATTTSLARDHWRQSVMEVTRSISTDPSEAKVNALLDAIE